MSGKREARRMLGYPDPPVIAPNSTREAAMQEIERWRGPMMEALQLDINTIEHMNRTRTEWTPISTDFERAMLEWVRTFPNGTNPPEMPPERAP